MIRRLSIVIAVVSFGLVFASLVIGYAERQSPRPLSESYIRLVPQELGAANVVTGILLTYRAFDTLGEVAVLFMVAAGIGLVLGGERPSRGVSFAASITSGAVDFSESTLKPSGRPKRRFSRMTFIR